MGTMTFGQQNTEEEGHELMDYCMERGVNFFDIAEMYSVPPTSETAGRSEEIVGTWLKKQDRAKVIIATKVRRLRGFVRQINQCTIRVPGRAGA